MAKEYIEREAVMQAFSDFVWNSNHSDLVPAPQWNHAVDIVRDFPAANVRENVTIRSWGDAIRAMSDEELAEFVEGDMCPGDGWSTGECKHKRSEDPKKCYLCWLDWLKSPVEEA